ncbi:hypothetical protein [Synechocystis sp. LKSZ1]|uniref:hypothetical protein n=1 Tax=Synechocystis sp. LKSZ1 TaxID=3144951 RepID=UPI00336C00AE
MKQWDYEILLAEYCSREGAIALLKQYRPYLEKLPSLRRPEQSIITIPLPLIRLRYPKVPQQNGEPLRPAPETVFLPCDLALLMCDPEWQVKLGAEILVFIHRPDEDFSDLLIRWRQSQIYLGKDYEWIMPPQEQHMFSESAEEICPLFILFEQTPPHIQKGLAGACLPYLIQSAGGEHQPETPVLVND